MMGKTKSGRYSKLRRGKARERDRDGVLGSRVHRYARRQSRIEECAFRFSGI